MIDPMTVCCGPQIIGSRTTNGRSHWYYSYTVALGIDQVLDDIILI